jgi:hypothetical protein
MRRCIEESGAETFPDVNDIATGDDFKATLRSELARADELVALFTPFSRHRVWLWSEVSIAWFTDKRIVAVFYGMTLADLAQDGGSGVLEDRHVRTLNDFDTYLAELRGRIERAR